MKCTENERNPFGRECGRKSAKGGMSSKPRDKVEPQLQSPAVTSLAEGFSTWLLWWGLKPDLFDPLPDDTTLQRVCRNSYSARWTMGFGKRVYMYYKRTSAHCSCHR